MQQKITVSIEVAAPIEKVWKYWTQPKHIVNWNFASDDWCSRRVENNLVIGERFKVRMEAKDGSAGFDFEGIYTDIVPLQSFSYVLDDGRVIEVMFESNGVSTVVTELFDPENENSNERQKEGWHAILENFKKYVESK